MGGAVFTPLPQPEHMLTSRMLLTTPAPEWHLHLLNADGSLMPYLQCIKEALDAVAFRAAACGVHLPPLDIIVQGQPSIVIPEMGLMGYCPHAGLIYLNLDPDNPNLTAHLGEPMERMLAHELHHALRWSGPGYGKTLLEALVSEGLAGQFVHELYFNPPEIYESAVPANQIIKLAGLALEEIKAYDHPHWFFGTGDLPRWSGYTLGYSLVANYLETHHKARPSKLAKIPAAAFHIHLENLASRKNVSGNI